MSPVTRALRDSRVWLAVYLVVLAGIAFWPSRVDEGAEPLLWRITELVPWLTYSRIEFGANIALFVPFGMLLALVLRQRYLVVPIALVTTMAIESVQALYGGNRTPSILDVMANLTGAAAGLVFITFVEWIRDRSRGCRVTEGVLPRTPR